MSVDAKFVKIQKIMPHASADALEIAMVSNYPCIVRKGEFKAGDLVFYIMDDAKLIGYDELKEREERDRLATETGSMVTQDCFTCRFPWQEQLLKYLGGGGRVKTIRLRGEVSMGILLKPSEVSNSKWNQRCRVNVTEDNYEAVNALIEDKEKGRDFLLNNFGIFHWEAPIGNVGTLDVAYQGLPEGLAVSDETNWEQLPERDLHLGRECLVTKKYDGSSATVTCYPDGRHEVSCRRMTFRDEPDESKMNTYQKLTREAVRAGLWWAKTHGEVIAFRGECCSGAFNRSSYNRDCQRDDFFVYGVNLPGRENWFEKNGLYGTGVHFTDIVAECNDAGFNVKHVEILEKDVPVTKDLLKKYNDMPWSWGEGAVLNVKVEKEDNDGFSSNVWHYKSKSREYLMKMK